ncbi:MAG: hypothetical protein GEU83_07595 [Pseudonocardiaceae bacterium]|nr:hypothetical protein [Pseudonocardiaceae bacterium]
MLAEMRAQRPEPGELVYVERRANSYAWFRNGIGTSLTGPEADTPLPDAWAPSVDHFTPVRVESDFEINIPDPRGSPDELGTGLVTADGHPIRYTDRIDMLVVDADDAYWAVQHRLVDDEWTDADMLLLDERTVTWCWGWELFYLGMRLAGTMYNELRPGHEKPDAAPAPIRHSHRGAG